jgi:putative hydrolase of the HAD superfamily
MVQYNQALQPEIGSNRDSAERFNRTINTVVFDLDDTLYDEVDYCRSGFSASACFLAEMIEDISPEKIFSTFWEQFCTGNQTRTFNGSLEMLGIDYNDELIEELVRVYREHKPVITLPRDSLRVLKKLKRKYTLALLTDGFLPAQKLKVQALKIEKFFTSIVYTEELGREFWKPSPAGFEKIVDNLKIQAENAAYIADNEQKDFIAPNNMGFLTIQLIRDAHIHTSSSLKSGFAAHHIIKKTGEIPALLEQYSK